jgi:hypothetical protein
VRGIARELLAVEKVFFSRALTDQLTAECEPRDPSGKPTT